MPTGKHLPQETVQRWAELHRAGASSCEIARAEGAKASTVLSALQRAGVYVRRRTKSPRCAFTVNRPDATKAQRFRAWNLRAKYGVTVEDVEKLEASQGGRCAICRRTAAEAGGKGERLHVDHDHVTQRVRGLLCGNCNTSLGKFQDSPDILRAAAAYLESSRG